MIDTTGRIHVALAISKTRVAPLKRLTIPRLELSGATLLAKLLHHVQNVLEIPPARVSAWTDSTVVLCWLTNSNPRRFKTFVGNRVSTIIDYISPKQWRHVPGDQNPADPASRGLYPSELRDCKLWWNGPEWLSKDDSEWPDMLRFSGEPEPGEVRVVSLPVSLTTQPVLSIADKYSSFVCLTRVTAWMLRFLYNCKQKGIELRAGFLTVEELRAAERYWVAVAQMSVFSEEITRVKRKVVLKGRLSHLRPFLDKHDILCVGGRSEHSKFPYVKCHPMILPKNHVVTKLIVRSEHLRLLHAGPTLVSASLSRRFYIVGNRSVIHSITRSCVICRRVSAKVQSQLLGQLPADRLTPGPVFQYTGVDYAGPVLVKQGKIRRPTLVKAYISIFVSFSVKAVHIELVSDLTTEAFLAAFRRFIARRGKPSVMWSDHGTNFTGANRELQQLFEFLHKQQSQYVISSFCATQGIQWKFIPERAPHFGGLWESVVKSTKGHLRKVVGNVNLSFEELTTILAQVEACLNSCPLVVADSDDGLEPLTPGHFLVGQPLEAIPDPASSYQPASVLRRWQLCQLLVRQFWIRWSTEYLKQLSKYTKWKYPSRNVQVNDLVCVKEENVVPTKWPLARVVSVYPGTDGLVRVATVKTSTGTYKRPITKLVLILPNVD